MKRLQDPSTRILDSAERLIQTRGFNGMSYADVSQELGITKASLHHHFASKAELGRALVERYSRVFAAALSAIDASGVDALRKLERYAGLYEEVLKGGRLCLCGMLAAEYDTLPPPMQKAIRRFFDANEEWLAATLEDGRKKKTLQLRGSPKDTGRALLSALEGAMLVARPFKDMEKFTAAARYLLNDLRARV